MIRHILDRNITLLILATMLLGYGITGIGYANEVSGVPHFHDDSTSRSVAENVSIDTNVGSPVSAHSPGTYGRYTLGGTDAASFTINEDNGQLKTNTTLDYETKNSYFVLLPTSLGILLAYIMISVSQTSCLTAVDILRNSQHVPLQR